MQAPDVLFIGPMKAGTTWIQEFLHNQGSVCLPKGVKETFYFDRNNSKGLEWYSSHFSHYDKSRHKHIVEVSPSYFHSEEAPKKIYDEIGSVSLVVTLRDPVKRAWSHYLHLRRYGYTRSNLQDASEEYPQLLAASSYAQNLEKWRKCFPDSKIYILWQEDLARNPAQYAEDICEILDLPFSGLSAVSLKRTNAAAVPPSPHLAALGRRFSYFLRSYRLYGCVNMAKKLGLKKFFFGSPGAQALPELSKKDEEWLSNKLLPDYNRLMLMVDDFKVR